MSENENRRNTASKGISSEGVSLPEEQLIERAVEVAGDFSRSTGLACAVLAPDSSLLGGTDPCSHFCNLTSNPTAHNCKAIHQFAGAQSLRFGGRYLYFCAHSLLYFSSPVVHNGLLIASLVAGPALLISHEEFVKEELPDNAFKAENNSGSVAEPGGDLYDALQRIPFLNGETSRSMSRLLMHSSSFVSGLNVQEYLSEEQEISRQSRISEYIHQIKTMAGEESGSYPIEMERKLLGHISRAEQDAAEEVLHALLAQMIIQTGSDIQQVKARILELTILLSRAAMEGGADAELIFGLNFRALQEINHFLSVNQLTSWIGRMMERFITLVFDVRTTKHRDVIFKAMQFINKNYSRPISLEEISSEVYLSPSYFSRLFKSETGNSFKQYLNEVRINRARELLADRSLTVIDVMEQTGFEDQSYFSRIFKRYSGLSPAKYRQSLKGYSYFDDHKAGHEHLK